jgi:hypothetical protein
VTLTRAHKDVDYYNRFADALSAQGPIADRVLECLSALSAGLGSNLLQPTCAAAGSAVVGVPLAAADG